MSFPRWRALPRCLPANPPCPRSTARRDREKARYSAKAAQAGRERRPVQVPFQRPSGFLPMNANEEHPFAMAGFDTRRLNVFRQFDCALEMAIRDFHQVAGANLILPPVAPGAAHRKPRPFDGHIDVLGTDSRQVELEQPTLRCAI